MKKHFSFLLVAAASAFMISPPSIATCGGGGGGGLGGLNGGRVYVVPWRKSLAAVTPTESLVLYWFPANLFDYKRSPLRFSRLLSVYAGHCVGLYTADPDSPPAKKYLGDDKPPAAVLVASDGTVVGKVSQADGILSAETVVQLLKTGVAARRETLNTLLQTADNKVQSGDKDGAVQDYKTVLDSSCMFPDLAGTAGQKLRQLGESIGPGTVPGGASFDPKVNTLVERTMTDGLKQELADHYVQAEKLYLSAHSMDPGDPVPLRYLGELYRHDLGDWNKARETFNEILSMHADPLSRAVALHGLGKMTIHEGNFQQGLKLMEQSVQLYPIAMACRNLAVYWNSEGDTVKAEKYAGQAADLEPDDPFNKVFAAVFMAGNGKTKEALDIARANENLMPASYNLAAIYAQSGQKDKALALLKRHFFEYERYPSVRSKEMMEARVDRVFTSLMQDKQFLALTAGADGKLPMRSMGASDARSK